MNAMRCLFLTGASLLVSSQAIASGVLGICAVIERVVFEPNAQAADSIQIYGAFAFYDGDVSLPSGYTSPMRGYMTFKMSSRVDPQSVRREWADLASIAGTGEAVAFGSYGYIGSFEGLTVDQPGNTGPGGYTLGFGMGVRPVTPEPSVPADYSPAGLGVVRLGEGNYDTIVAELRALLVR